MNTEWLQSLSAAILMLGIVFAGLGGVGTYYFSHKAARENEEKSVTKEKELSAWIKTLEHTNEELRTQGTSPSEVTLYQLQQPDLTEPKHEPAVQPGPTPGEAITKAIQEQVAKPSPTVQPVRVQAPVLISSIGTRAASPAPAAQTPVLTEKQYQEIVDVLRKHAGKTITICSAGTNPRGMDFALSLKSTFEKAGWHVEGVKQIASPKLIVGLNLSAGTFPSPEGLVAAYMALTGAGLNVSQQLDSKLTGGQAQLTVGTMP